MATSKLTPFDGQLDDEQPASTLTPFTGQLDGEKPRTRGLFEAVNDNVIEFANAAAGGVSALANMVKPGNAVSSFIDENIIKAGEQKQSDVVQGAKRQLSEGLQSAQGIGDEVGAVGSYVLNNPLLAASQAAGSFALPGGAVKGAGAAAKALGAGAKGIETAGRVGGIAAGAAMAGGDAAGTAYDLASKAGATEDQAIAAGRQASVIPALVGGVTGAFGAERLLAGAKGFGGNALSRGLKSGLSEAGQEAVEEGVTQFEGQRAAMPYDESIDPTKGVAGAAAMGGIMGFGPGAVLGAMGDAKPSQQMGIDPNAGPLSRAAASAVDSQPVPPAEPTQSIGGSITGTAPESLMGRAYDPLAAQIMERRQQEAADATPAKQSEPVPLEQRSLDELRQAFRSAQDPAIRKTLAAEIRKRREAMPDPLAQPQQEISLEPQAVETQQGSEKEQKPSTDTVSTGVLQQPVEQATEQATKELGQPLTDTGTDMLGRGADPLQSIIQGQADARRAADELRGTAGASTVTGGDITPSGVESPVADVRSGGRNNDAGTAQPDANGDAGRAVGGTAQGSAALTPTSSLASDSSWIIRNKETGEVVMETFDKKKVDALNTQKYEAVPALKYLQEFNKRVKDGDQSVMAKRPDQQIAANQRPDNWRENAIKAGKVARSLGLDPKGKRLKEIVAEIDAVDAGSGVAAKPASREQAIRDAWRKEPRTIGKWTPISVEAEGQKADMLVNQKRAGGDKDGALHVVNIRMGKMLKDMEREPIAYTFRLTSDNRLVEEGIPTVATPGQIAAWKGAGFALDDKQANVQNTPQGTAGEAKAPAVEASKAEGGNAASSAGVPAAPGAGDVQADGVKEEAKKDAAPAAQAEKPAEDDAFMGVEDQTQTEAFKKWFAGSKVVDDQGKPLVVYRSNAVDSVLSGEPQRPESGMDGLRGNAELVANLLQGPTFRLEGLRGFDAPTQRVVLAAVRGFGLDSKVLRSVVDLVPVDVVNVLAGQNLSPESLFSDEAVLKNLLSVNSDRPIAAAVDVADALVSAVTGMTAKAPGVSGNGVGSLLDGGSASGTGEVNVFLSTHGGKLQAVDATMVQQKSKGTGNRGTFDPANPDIRLDAATGDSTQTTYTPASEAQQKAVTAFADRLSKNRDSFVLMDAVKPSGARQQEAQSVANLAKTMFGREVVFVKFKGRPLFNGAVSTTDPGKIFVNIESARPMMAVLGHELLHELRKSNPAAYNQLAKTLKTVTKDDYIYEALLKKKYRDQGLNWTPQDISEELYGDIVGDNFMDPKFWEAIAGDKPIFAKQLYRAVMNWLDKIASMFKRVKVRQDGSMVLTLAEQADGSRPFGTQKYLQDIEAARAAVAQAMGQFGKTKTQEQTDALSIADAVEQIGKQASVKPVVQALNDTFSVRGKIHWWHKTVGTPFNLAERVPEFKRVFNSVQDFINSVSFYGAEAAAMAPKIIPKLESWKDLGKSPIKAEDNKAIAAPIFEGTLSWRRGKNGVPVQTDDVGEAGIVWTDDELRSKFKLSDEQIGLYREFRAATDKSLTDLALSDILQFAGKDAEPIKDTVMGMSLKEGSETVSRYLKSLAEGEDKVRKAMLFDTANSIKDKADKAQSLMDRGYAPLQRFGRHTLYATNEKGEQLFFGMYEDRWAAARAARQMREQYPGATVEVGMMSEQSYKMFQGISPETLELFGTMLGLDTQADGQTNEAFQTYLKLAKSNRSALKRLIERKGISGYSEDASRVLASFIYSNARQTASNLHVGEIMNGVNDIPRSMGEAKDAAVKLARYTMDPQEEAQALRGLLFAQYLGGSIASAAINALQPAQVTFPYLSQFVGAKKSASLMTGAVRDAIKKSTGDPKLDAELRKAEEEGIVSPQEIFQLMAQAQGKATLKAGDGTKAGDAMAAASNTLSRLSLGWGKVFSIPEQFNRRTTFIAAYRTAKETGEANPYEFAKQAVKETQLVYNKGNRPEWARGTIGALAFTFKTYSISYVELLQRMAASGPEGRRAALLMVGVLFIMAGAGGLPGVEDAEDVVDGIAQRVFGLNFQTRQKRQEWLADTFGEGGARFIENGLSGLPWSPTDVSGRLGLGNLIPGTGLFVKKQDYGRDVAELAGPAADMTKRFLEGAGLLLQGEFLKAGEIVSPTAVRNMIQGGRMLATDQYTDTKGRKVIDTTPAEGITKMIGFQPADVARVQEATGTTQRMIALNKIRESEIADKWAKGLASGDADVVQEARDELRKWNESNPESPIRINMPQLFRRVRALKEDKATRIARTAPKEIRQDVRRALEQGQ